MATDLNYQVYLRSVFNRAFDDLIRTGLTQTIVCSGGPTDMRKPYRRTEAEEMIRELKRMVARLPKEYRAQWRFVAENKSLSTLENLLFVKRIVGNRPMTICCEWTRRKRIQKTVRLVFGKMQAATVLGFDFDVSANRYRLTETLAKREREMLRFDQWSVRGPKNLRRHHAAYLQRLRFLRSYGPDRHVEAVNAWYVRAPQLFPDIAKYVS